MSSAARELLRGDELPALPVATLSLREADPSPGRGPERDTLAALGEARVRRNEDAMLTALDGYLDRLLGVTLARLRGPRARKGTRWWSDRVTSEKKAGGVGSTSTYTATYEVKALDSDYVLPPKTVTEVAELVRPVGIAIVADSVADTARRLGRPNVGLAVFDQQAVNRAVEDAVRRMLAVADRHATEVRRAILDADTTAKDLDEVLDRVREAHRRGGNWVRLAGRTLAISLGNDASLASARALGVTHVQWLATRVPGGRILDDRVRDSHRIADGQIRRVGDKFRVGRHLLRYPGDPEGLPDTWEEVANCRCSLLLSPVDQDKSTVVRTARKGTAAETARLVRAADGLAMASALGDEPRVVGAPADLDLPGFVPAVPLTAPIAAYRVLAGPLGMSAGQWMSVAAGTAFGLAVPVVASALVLTVVVPAGFTVGVGGGALVLPAGTVLEIVSVTSAGIVAQPVV